MIRILEPDKEWIFKQGLGEADGTTDHVVMLSSVPPNAGDPITTIQMKIRDKHYDTYK